MRPSQQLIWDEVQVVEVLKVALGDELDELRDDLPFELDELIELIELIVLIVLIVLVDLDDLVLLLLSLRLMYLS